MSLIVRTVCIGILGAGVWLVYMGTTFSKPKSLATPIPYNEKELGSELQKQATLLFQEREVLRSAALFENMLERTPKNKNIRAQLGILYAKLADIAQAQGEPEKERALRRRALEFKPVQNN